MNDTEKALARIKRGIQLAVDANSEEAIKELTTTKEALEKQIPKRAIENDLCPTCKSYLNSDLEDSYCFNCGQAIYFGGIKDECN